MTARPLRLLVVTAGFPPQVGGTERYLAELLPALGEVGCTAHVLAQRASSGAASVPGRRGTAPSALPVPEDGGPGTDPTCCGLVVERVGRWRIATAMAGRLSLGSAGGRIELVHIHGYSRPMLAQTLLVARHYGIPVVWSLHGGLLHPPFGHGKAARAVMRGFDRWALGHLLPTVRAFVVLADTQVDHLVRRQVPADWVHLLPNMVPGDVLGFGGRPEPSGRLIAVGRLAPEKRLADLIDAIALDPTLPDVDIVGPEGGVGPELRRHAMELAPGRVRFVGVPERSDLVRRVAASRALVLPSAWEGQPMAALEALALGVPVVASHQAAHALPDDGVTRFPAGDVMALAGALHATATGAGHRRRRSSANCSSTGVMTARAHAERLRQVYLGVLADSRPGSFGEAATVVAGGG